MQSHGNWVPKWKRDSRRCRYPESLCSSFDVETVQHIYSITPNQGQKYTSEIIESLVVASLQVKVKNNKPDGLVLW